MGERGSITVRKEDWPFNEQPVLFRHWAGHHEDMQALVDRLKETLPPKGPGDPYSRRDPDAVMALVVRLAAESDGFSAYLATSRRGGDDSDHGHYLLDLDRLELQHIDPGFGCSVCEAEGAGLGGGGGDDG